MLRWRLGVAAPEAGSRAGREGKIATPLVTRAHSPHTETSRSPPWVLLTPLASPRCVSATAERRGDVVGSGRAWGGRCSRFCQLAITARPARCVEKTGWRSETTRRAETSGMGGPLGQTTAHSHCQTLAVWDRRPSPARAVGSRSSPARPAHPAGSAPRPRGPRRTKDRRAPP